MMNRILIAAAVMAALFSVPSVFAEGSFDCPAMCEQGVKQSLEKCKANHKDNPGQCPQDNGQIPQECRRICGQLSGMKPEDLQKMLPGNYQDILEGK